jgi:hypothetical protein
VNKTTKLGGSIILALSGELYDLDRETFLQAVASAGQLEHSTSIIEWAFVGAEGLEKRIAACEKPAETEAQREGLASMRRRRADLRAK